MKRLKAMFLSMVLVLLFCACNNSVDDTSREEVKDSLVENPGDNGDDSYTDKGEGIILDGENSVDKVYIDDFYQYALSEWLEDTEVDPRRMSALYDDSYDAVVFDNIETILNDSEYSSDPSMGKLIQFYNQLKDSELREKSVLHIQNMVDEVEAVNSLDDYFDLITDPVYWSMEYLISREYAYTDSCEYIIQFKSLPYSANITITDEEREFLREALAREFMLVGFGDEEAYAKADNAILVNDLISAVNTYGNSYISYWNQYSYFDDVHAVPLCTLLKEMGYERYYKGREGEYYEFFIADGLIEFYDEFVVEDNLSLIKDYYEANMFSYLFPLGSMEMMEASTVIAEGLNGYPLDDIFNTSFIGEDEFYENALSEALSVDNGHIASKYYERYVSQEVIDEANAMADLIKNAYIDIINEEDWLSTRVKDKLKMRIKKIEIRYGEYDGYPSYEDVVIGEDPIETVFNFVICNRTYMKKYLTATEGISFDRINLYSSNGEYSVDSNTVLLTFGTLQSLEENMEESFETKLGIFGATLTHEMAHALAPYHIYYGTDGVYMDYFTDYEYEVINNTLDVYSEMINGVPTDNGYYFNGAMCANELFSDILSVRCSLHILEDIENADYDDFFVNYAKGYGRNMTEGYESFVCKNMNHVEGKLRVNLVLYQFDKFYDTYDVDASNRWYVEPEKRLIDYVS